jgi:putative endonuclease
MINSAHSNYPKIGDLGEQLVVQWLQSTGWQILHRRFASPWGEIDIIATQGQEAIASPILAFVEVKTRSAGNWDAGGRKAITLKKQAKLWQTAEIFLGKYPEKANYTCRFDVAIISYYKISTLKYEFKLQEYIPAAFNQ